MHSSKKNRTCLVDNLREAAELEHQFMCQYLYAALSIKKVCDDNCKPYQLEMARRWASSLYMVARQEMEHLALANNLLRGIGEAPYFYRCNIDEKPLQGRRLGAPPSEGDPTISGADECCAQYDPIEQRYALDPFNLCTVQRFACMESPDCKTLLENKGDPFPHFCFEKKDVAIVKSREGVEPGTVQCLYKEIEAGFKVLPASDFVSKADEQVEIIQQYDIFVFPVTDHASAQQALSLITEQGEGIGASPTYQSHFRRFMDMRREYYEELFPNGGEAVDPCKNGGEAVDPCKNGLYDPDTASFQPGLPLQPKEGKIAVGYTSEVFDLFNQSYGTLLVMLTGLYATVNQKPSSYPYFAAALGQEAFAPFMTMIVRTLGEVLVQLRAGGTGEDAFSIGPNFYLPCPLQQDLKRPFEGGDLLPVFGDIECILERTADFSRRLKVLVGEDPPTLNPDASAAVQTRMKYMCENAERITVNLRRIYQQGIYKALDPGTF